jgi:hypothetical protein
MIKVWSTEMKTKFPYLVAAALVLITGLVHLYLAPSETVEAPYIGFLFVLNFLAACLAAALLRRDNFWGWALGFLVAIGSISGCILSRASGMPGMEVEEWLYPLGLFSLALEMIIIALFYLARPWQKLNPAGRRAAEFIPALSLLLIIGSLFAPLAWGSLQSGAHLADWKDAAPLSAEKLASDYGLEVKMVGLTMMDSVVDLRMTVIDAEKAKKLLGEGGMMPVLVDTTSDTALMAPMPHGHRHALQTGRIFYAFYPNSGGIVRPGTPLALIFGSLRLEQTIPAQ